jgi:hypothetical protein
MDRAEAAITALAAGETDQASDAVEQARAQKEVTLASFPALVVNDTATLAFAEIYPDLYHVDLLIMISFQWPDTSPTEITQMKELVDDLADNLARLRRWRAQPWADGAAADGTNAHGTRPGLAGALTGLDSLIDRTDQLRADLDALTPGTRLDPRLYTWMGQDFKETFLNGVGETDLLGTMYTFLFPLDHALHRARWSLANRKLAGASRRLVEARRVNGLFLDWFREHEPTS